MKKQPHWIMQAIMLAGAYTAFNIGSGFATGNEVMQFFNSWGGYWPYIIWLLGLVFAVVTNYIMYNTGMTVSMEEYKSPYQYYCGKTIGKIFDIYVYVCLIAFVLVMISGSGATVNQYYHLPEWIGTIGMGILCGAIACLGLRKLVDVLGSIGIIILLFTVGCAVYMVCTADTSPIEASARATEYVTEGKILQPNVFGIKHPLVCGFSYSGVLMMCCIAWVHATGALLKDRKQMLLTAGLSSAFYYLPVLAVVLALALNLDAIAGSQIPMLAAVQNMIPKLAGPYTIIIILGIFTTATGQLFLLGDRFAKEGTAKFYIVIFGIVAFAIVGGLFLPFSVIVNIVYSVMGMTGIIMAAFMVVKVLMVCASARKAAPAEVETAE